jgi:serine O-acetyltransferase
MIRNSYICPKLAGLVQLRHVENGSRGRRSVVLMLDHGEWASKSHSVSHGLYKAGYRRVACGLWKVTRIVTQVDIHPLASIGRGLKMPHPNGIVIGMYARVGDDVTILQQVTLGAVRPDVPFSESTLPLICDGAVLGSGCRVLGGVTVGAGAVIGANAVVLSDVPPHSTAVGVPARIVPCRRETDERAHQAEDR